jgi:glycerol kinase
MTHLIAIDQGTTSTRAIVFDGKLKTVAVSQQELRQIYPAAGWVEHCPEEIWSAVVATVREAMAKAGVCARDIAGIGITNQRETTIVWDRATGKPIHNAIVWQDRRTADACAALHATGHETEITRRTGLVLDPYFSASKISWLLENTIGARDAAHQGKLAFGTVDTFILWRLTGGKVHATDAPACSPFPHRCSPRSATVPPTSERRCLICSRVRSAFSASPAINRRPRSARVALRRA